MASDEPCFQVSYGAESYQGPRGDFCEPKALGKHNSTAPLPCPEGRINSFSEKCGMKAEHVHFPVYMKCSYLWRLTAESYILKFPAGLSNGMAKSNIVAKTKSWEHGKHRLNQFFWRKWQHKLTHSAKTTTKVKPVFFVSIKTKTKQLFSACA